MPTKKAPEGTRGREYRYWKQHPRPRRLNDVSKWLCQSSKVAWGAALPSLAKSLPFFGTLCIGGTYQFFYVCIKKV